MQGRIAATLILAGLALPFALSAQTDPNARQPGIAVQQQGNVTNILTVDPDLTKQMQLLAAVRQMPADQAAAIVPWLTTNAHKLVPAFTYELSRRLWDLGRKDEAFEWFSLAGLRARYDAMRCVDATAPQGITFLPPIAQNVVADIAANREAFGQAGLRALARPDLFATPDVSPWWICSHGMNAVMAGMEKRTVDGPAWLKPESEWAGFRERIVLQNRTYFEEQGKPQPDPIPMTRTPFPTASVSFGTVHTMTWLDNERLALSRVDRQGTPSNILALWQKDRGVTEIARFIGAWCAGNGQVSYITSVDGGPKAVTRRTTFMTGPVGRLKEQTIEHAGYLVAPSQLHEGDVGFTASGDEPMRRSPFDCRWVRSERLSGPAKDRWIPLLPDHGFLAYTRPDGTPSERLLYYPQENAAPVELPVPAKQVTPSAVRYAAYRKAYFMSPVVSPVRQGEPVPACRAVWWLQPGGKVEEHCIPTDEMDRHGYTYTPSQAGLLRVSYGRRTPHGLLPGGVYLMKADGSSEKIHESLTWGSTVSPDGCGLAVRSFPATAGGDSPVTVISLCGRNTTSRQPR